MAPIATETKTAEFFPGHNSKRHTVKYGPFSVPGMMTNNGMKTFERYIEPPCSDCLITWMQAGLEYPNGTIANADTSLWLHHVVLYNLGSNNTVCGTQVEAMFASGNERTVIDICVNGTDKAGYYLKSGGSVVMLLELMNMDMSTQEAVLTYTFEFIPKLPSGFSPTKVLWLDIGGCESSSELPAKKDQLFQYSSSPWTSASTSGRIVFIAGHIHDGGTHLNIYHNGKVICDSVAEYGQNAAYISPASSMPGMSMNNSKHISSLSTCVNDGSLKVGDTMSVTAFYDTKKWMPMTNTDGSLAPIMGISLVYLATNEKDVAAGKESSIATSMTAAPESSSMVMSSAMSGMSMSSSMSGMSVSSSSPTSTSAAAASATGNIASGLSSSIRGFWQIALAGLIAIRGQV